MRKNLHDMSWLDIKINLTVDIIKHDFRMKWRTNDECNFVNITPRCICSMCIYLYHFLLHIELQLGIPLPDLAKSPFTMKEERPHVQCTCTSLHVPFKGWSKRFLKRNKFISNLQLLLKAKEKDPFTPSQENNYYYITSQSYRERYC